MVEREGPSALLIPLGDGEVERLRFWGWILQPSGSVTSTFLLRMTCLLVLVHNVNF
jgi:hypothetical protein